MKIKHLLLGITVIAIMASCSKNQDATSILNKDEIAAIIKDTPIGKQDKWYYSGEEFKMIYNIDSSIYLNNHFDRYDTALNQLGINYFYTEEKARIVDGSIAYAINAIADSTLATCIAISNNGDTKVFKKNAKLVYSSVGSVRVNLNLDKKFYAENKSLYVKVTDYFFKDEDIVVGIDIKSLYKFMKSQKK